MGKLIPTYFQLLTEVPINFWFWLLLFTAPCFILMAKPETPLYIRNLRILSAIILTYILINLSLYTSRQIEWKIYQNCQEQFSDGALNHHNECGLLKAGRGASTSFYLIFGLIPAIAYVGIWELLWKKFYRKRIKNMGEDYKGQKISKAIFYISFPVWIYCSIILLMIIYLSTCHWFSRSEKCLFSNQFLSQHES